MTRAYLIPVAKLPEAEVLVGVGEFSVAVGTADAATHYGCNAPEPFACEADLLGIGALVGDEWEVLTQENGLHFVWGDETTSGDA